MKLRTIAYIATIIGTVFVGLQYYSSTSSSIKLTIPEILTEKKSEIELSLDMESYQEEKGWLLAAYQAAMEMPYSTGKRDGLITVVNKALEIKDFNLAVLAAKNIPYSTDKSEALHSIVKIACQDKQYLPYALLAASEIPYAGRKEDALKMIVDAAENYEPIDAEKQPQVSESIQESDNSPQISDSVLKSTMSSRVSDSMMIEKK